jgi:hypothetical protein
MRFDSLITNEEGELLCPHRGSAITSGTRTTPPFEEVSLNCEINSYANAEL